MAADETSEPQKPDMEWVTQLLPFGMQMGACACGARKKLSGSICWLIWYVTT